MRRDNLSGTKYPINNFDDDDDDDFQGYDSCLAERERDVNFIFLHILHTHELHTLPILLLFGPVDNTNNCELTIIIGFCSNSSASIPHAHTLQQDPSAFWRDRTTDCPCCVLTVRVDTIWYAIFCSKSVHFRALLVVPALKSANDGNDDEVNAENDDAPGALN